MSNKINELADNLLENVNGGGVDWKAFSEKFLLAFRTADITMKAEYKDLIEAIQSKNYVQVAIIVIPLLAQGDELIKKIIEECKS